MRGVERVGMGEEQWSWLYGWGVSVHRFGELSWSDDIRDWISESRRDLFAEICVVRAATSRVRA